MKRDELLALARRHMWAAWSLSSEELASQAAETLIGLGMLVPEGGAQALERLLARVTELEAEAYGDATVRLLTPVEQIRHLHACVATQMSRANTLDRLCREQRARADAAEERVAELEAERHSTNEALADVTVALRAAEGPADGITRRIAPTQALQLEDPHDSPLHHPYRVSRDLPETGSAR